MSASYDLLRAQPFFEGLSDWQLERLAMHAQRSMFHAGNRVFREADEADRMWLIVTGRVAVITDVPGRGEVVIDTLGPGAVLGWSWLVPPYRWRFSATAIETTLTVELDGSSVRELCHNDLGLGFQVALAVIRVVTDRLEAIRRRLATGCHAEGCDRVSELGQTDD
jgi:CRP/FNR family transcriptional regulator, cyclic AMP receptor protein